MGVCVLRDIACERVGEKKRKVEEEKLKEDRFRWAKSIKLKVDFLQFFHDNVQTRNHAPLLVMEYW